MEPGSDVVPETVLGPGTASDTGLDPFLAFETVLRPDLAFTTFLTVLGPLVVFGTGF